MNRTIEDSKNYDVVCMSFGKEKQRGIEVIKAGKKDSFLEQTMDIEAKSCSMDSLKLSNEQKQQVKKNRETRITENALRRKSMLNQR